MQSQITKQRAPAQKPILPQVRYHPSIQTSRSSQRTGPDAAHHPQTRTNLQGVQNQDTTNRAIPAVRPDKDSPQKPRTDPPRPEMDPEAAQNQDTTNRTIPAVRPDPDPSQKPRTDPPRPEPAPVGFGAQMDRGLVENVEVLTRGQRTNPDWFAWRKNRITASVAHSIAHCRFVNGKSTTPPCSYLAAVTGKPRLLPPGHR